MKTGRNGFYLVGVDCSTDPKNVGIALVKIDDNKEGVWVCYVHARIANSWEKVAE